jgi:putative membrane protein
LPGIVLRLRTDLIAPGYYLHLHRPWGPGPASDQRTGGAILWLVGEVIDLPFLAILVTRWIKTDEREAATIDRALDARASNEQSGLDPTPTPERDVPWWEIDATVFGERRGAAYRRGPHPER